MHDSEKSDTACPQSVLIDIGHPAHVHLFRNFARHLKKKGIPLVITSRNKDLTNTLLDHYALAHITISQQSVTMIGQILEFLVRTFRILKLHYHHRFTLAIGTSVSIGFLSLLTFGRVRSYNFCEDDDDAVPLQAALAYPFSTRIVNPDCIRFKCWASKRILLPTYHELAYLHPDHFSPNPDIPRQYGLEPEQYIILRLSSLKAHHDRNEKGISPELLHKVREAIGSLKIIESRELSEEHYVAPWEMHDLLAFAKLIISDSQTMTAEAALLGTPSIRISTFKNRLSYLEEIEERCSNAYSFYPGNTDSILLTIDSILRSSENPDYRSSVIAWIRQEKFNLSIWMRKAFDTE